MDVQYGVAVTNKYDLFCDDEDIDPFDIIRQKEEESKTKAVGKGEKKKPAKKAALQKTKQEEQTPKPREGKPATPRQRGRGGYGGRELRENEGSRAPRRQGPRPYHEGGRGDENVPPEMRSRDMDREWGQGGPERGRGGRGGRGGGRGRGRGAPRPESGRGGYFAASGERRREFDRHSGTDKTGVKSIDKRDGSGAHNWGSYKDDVADGVDQNANPDVSGESAPAPDSQENPELEGDAAAPPQDEGPKEMTLDEWKALQEQKRVKTSFNIRKAGEGVDNSKWQKGVQYKKKTLDSEEEEESEEEDEEEDDRHQRKQLVNIRITFADNHGRGGRGRGGPRGRGSQRGRGFGDRAGNPNRGGHHEAAPRMDDEADFPSLVKSKA